MTKQKWVDNGLKTPAYAEKLSSIIAGNENQNLFLGDTTKYVLKPDKSGSSVGIKISNNVKELSTSLASVNSPYEEYFIEEYIEGYEYTAPIIGDTVFPIIKIETKREFYDYQAKYIDDDTSFTFPEFKSDMLEKIESTCLKAFKVLGCKGWGRVDFFIDKDNEISLIEINTIPGMTDHSLVPMSASHINISYIELIEKILSQ